MRVMQEGQTSVNKPRYRPRRSAGAFSLVELLTVIFIISLLIGILIPSLSASRNAAKKLTTSKALDSIKTGLEMFKNENAAEFPQTNGYPPSFAHPPIAGFDFNPELGEFPFRPEKPVVYGAHWLPAMLTGVDQLGYIKRRTVPNINELRKDPTKWYTVDALGADKPITERSPLYIDPNGLRLTKTKDLPGRPNKNLFEKWQDPNTDPLDLGNLPVIVDAFDQPILYYAANPHGRTTNMAADIRDRTNDYTGGPQEQGPPFYFHQDNVGFTGNRSAEGWEFSNSEKGHAIRLSGAELAAADVVDDANRETFARYIVDRKVYSALKTQPSPSPATPLRPVNADTYLLISAGVDGRYGTADDVSNLPPWPEQ